MSRWVSLVMVAMVAACGSTPASHSTPSTGGAVPASRAPVSTTGTAGTGTRFYIDILVADGGYQCGGPNNENVWSCSNNDGSFDAYFPADDAVVMVTYVNRAFLVPCTEVTRTLQPYTDAFLIECLDDRVQFSGQYPMTTPAVEGASAFLNRINTIIASHGAIFQPGNDQRSAGQVAVDLAATAGATCTARESNWDCSLDSQPFGISFGTETPPVIMFNTNVTRAFAKPCSKFDNAIKDLTTTDFVVLCDDTDQVFRFQTRIVYRPEMDGIAWLRAHLEKVAKSLELLRSIKALRQ